MTHDEIPTISVRQITIEDDHAAPFAREGDVILIDPFDDKPTDGDLFLTLTDKGKMVVVGFADIGIGWLARCPNRRRVVGPCSIEFLRTVTLGRVIWVGRTLDRGMKAKTVDY